MGAGHVSEIPVRPCLFRHSHWSWARWGSLVFGWGLVAGGSFFSGISLWRSRCVGAGQFVDAAGSAA